MTITPRTDNVCQTHLTTAGSNETFQTKLSKLALSQGGGCAWWHFYPDEGVRQLEQKFQEIMSGQANRYHMLDCMVWCGPTSASVTSLVSGPQLSLRTSVLSNKSCYTPATRGLTDLLVQGAKGVKNSLLSSFMSVETLPRQDPKGEVELWKDHRSKV